MPQPWHTILAAFAGTLLILAFVFRVALKWISSRTAFGLCAVAVTLNLVRAVARGAWVWALFDLVAAALFAWWWAERPARTEA